MLLPSDIAKMPPDTPAEVFARVFDQADWEQFYILTIAEATRRTPAALSELIRDPGIRDDWHDALLCYIDDCQLSLMTRTTNYGPQDARTESARRNLHYARKRLDWLVKNPPGKDRPNPNARRWAVGQLIEDNPQEFERILAVTADDPGRASIPGCIDVSRPLAEWCIAAGYPYKPLTPEQETLAEAQHKDLRAAVWAEIHDYSTETVFDHPFLVQRWRDTLLDLNRKMRESLGLPPGMPMPYLRSSELVLEAGMSRPRRLARVENLRKLTALFRRQREAVRAYDRIVDELHDWLRAHTRSAHFKAGQVLAARYPVELDAYVKNWVPPQGPPPPDVEVARRWYPVNAGAFMDMAARFGWDVTLNHPQLNPHTNPKAAGAVVVAVARPGGRAPKVVVSWRRKSRQRTVTRAWVKARPGDRWMTLQDLTAATAMLGLNDDLIETAVLVRAAKLDEAAARRRELGKEPTPDPHLFDLT